MCNRQKKVLLCLIDTYKEMPYLWQKDHKDYMNKDIRAKGYKVLLQIYKTFDEEATEKIMKKKIENMRTSYVKEFKKVSASKHTDEVYVPTLWYFDALSFLGTTIECYRTDTDPLQIEISSPDCKCGIVSNSGSGLQNNRKEDSPLQKQDNIPLSAEKNMSERDDESTAYGRSIGFQMRDLNKRQLMISQKLISDVIFYAKLDQLSESSYVVLGPTIVSLPNK